MVYPVTLTTDDNDSVLVTFPDIPEAVSSGSTPQEALSNATQALLTAFDALMKDRREIPSPSSIDDGPYVTVPALEATKIALYRAMREAHVNKMELSRRLHWHPPQVDRVLKIRHGSQLEQLEAAFAAVGKRLIVDTVDLHPSPAFAVSREHATGVRSARPASGRRQPVRATLARKAAKKR